MYSLRASFTGSKARGRIFSISFPAGAFSRWTGMTSEILQTLEQTPLSREDLVDALCSDGYSASEAEECIDELHEVHAIRNGNEGVRKVRAAAGGISPADAGDEPHQPVQSVLPILLRIRRGQSGDARRQAEVHGFRDGQGSVDFLLANRRARAFTSRSSAARR